jgi:hypothetical protein
MTEEERKARYFSPVLPKGKTEFEYVIRILPGKNGGKAISNVWYHEIDVPGYPSDNGKPKLYDPAKNEGKRSPISEVYEELIKEDPVKNKEVAKKYLSKLFYIVKVIDRANESDGPKFWRFKHDHRKQGVYDKIMAIWESKGSLSDAENGRDIIIKVVEQKNPQTKKPYPSVVSILYEDKGPLHTNKELAASWIEDPDTWEDVYSKKPVEYLEAVARGKTPRWDKNQNKYVYDSDIDSEDSFGGAPIKNEPTKEPDLDLQADEDPFEELPF